MSTRGFQSVHNVHRSGFTSRALARRIAEERRQAKQREFQSVHNVFDDRMFTMVAAFHMNSSHYEVLT